MALSPGPLWACWRLIFLVGRGQLDPKALAGIGILWGAVVALRQTDFKFVIGYSSVSHMGYVLLGVAVLTPLGLDGAVLLMFAHGLSIAALFVAGYIPGLLLGVGLMIFGGVIANRNRYPVGEKISVGEAGCET